MHPTLILYFGEKKNDSSGTNVNSFGWLSVRRTVLGLFGFFYLIAKTGEHTQTNKLYIHRVRVMMAQT